jgi:hypothetical protein
MLLQFRRHQALVGVQHCSSCLIWMLHTPVLFRLTVRQCKIAALLLLCNSVLTAGC